MNNIVKNVGIFLAGLGLGGGGMYLLLNKRFEDRLNAEAAELRESYSQKPTEEPLLDMTNTQNEAKDNILTKYRKASDKYKSIEEIPTEDIPIEEKEREEDGEEDDGFYDENGNTPYDYYIFDDPDDAPTHNRPYLVPFDEYGNNQNYSTIDVTMYADDILVEDLTKKVIPNDEKILGAFEEGFGLDPHDPYVVYIKNDILKSYYCIVKSEELFSDQ